MSRLSGLDRVVWQTSVCADILGPRRPYRGTRLCFPWGFAAEVGMVVGRSGSRVGVTFHVVELGYVAFSLRADVWPQMGGRWVRTFPSGSPAPVFPWDFGNLLCALLFSFHHSGT